MTLQEAQTMLAEVPETDDPWSANPSLTLAQAAQSIREALPTLEWPKGSKRGPNDPLGPIGERRVNQVCKNQKRPRY